MADWQSFAIQVPGKDLLEPLRNILETLLVYLEILKTLLDTIKTFLIDFGNPIKALVQALLALINELLNSLRVSGFFGYFDFPDPTTDPNFDKVYGGTAAFNYRFKQSLFDSKDLNRPQPRQGSTKSGFVLIVVEAETVFGLLRLIQQLKRFFGQEFSSPRYEAPANIKALPVGDSGDPILAIASIFSQGIKAVELSWTLPTNMETPDPGFRDLVTKVADEFVPPSFLIERADIAPTKPLDASTSDATSPVNLTVLHDTTSTGPVQYDFTTEYTVQGSPGTRLKTKRTLRDTNGEPVIKFQRYTTITGVNVTNILGQLGRFRYIDTDVEIGKTYYYRVRSYSGDLDVPNAGTSTSYVNWKAADPPGRNPEVAEFTVRWPSTSDDPVIMGKATAILPVTLPKVIPNFDVISELRQLFKLAFALDFHLPLSPDAQFDENGDPINGTPAAQVGRGSIQDIASTLAAFQSLPLVGELAALEAAGKGPEASAVTGEYAKFPWQEFNVIRQSSRLALSFGQAMLEAGSNVIEDFRNYMQGAFPAGTPDPKVLNPAQPATMENMVYWITRLPTGTASNETLVDGSIETGTIQSISTTYTLAYFGTPLTGDTSDPTVRKNVLAVIRFLLSFNGVGASVDWISIQPLRDIIPWSGQLIYQLLDAVQKLLNAFQGVLDEIKAFIDLVERKIDALERFIEFLINILDFIESLEVGAYILNASGIQGDASEWANIVDTAGNPPPQRPGGYSAGVALAYVAPDVTAFETAFNIIF